MLGRRTRSRVGSRADIVRLIRWFGVVMLLIGVTIAGPSITSAAQIATPPVTPGTANPPASCPVTIPNGSVPPFGNLGHFPGPVFHGENGIWTSFGANGTVAWSPEMNSFGGNYGIKFLWYFAEGVHGPFRVTGQRLDAPAPPLRADTADQAVPDFSPSGLTFPTLGCWRITASAGNRTMTFTIWLYEGQPKLPSADWTSPTPPAYCHVTRQASKAANPDALPEAPAGSVAVGDDQLVAFLPANGTFEVTASSGTATRDALSTPFEGVTLHWWQNRDNPFLPLISGDGVASFGGSGTIDYDLGTGQPEGAMATPVAFSSPGCWRMEIVAGKASISFTIWLWARELPGTATPSAATPIAAVPTGATPPASCPVTIPNSDVPPFGNLGFFPGPVFHGDNGIWTSFGADGTVAWSPNMDMDGGGYGVKFLWFHDERARGHLQITGHLLGGSAPPLTANVPGGYGEIGYQASGLDFPRLGCWRITAAAGGSSMTFTIWLYEGEPQPIRSTWTSSTPPAYCHVTRPPSTGVNPAALRGAPAGDIAVGDDQIAAFLPPTGTYELTYQPDTTQDAWQGFVLHWWQNKANDLQPLMDGELTAGYGGAGNISYDIGASVSKGPVTTRLAFSSPGCWRIELRANEASTTFTIWLWTRELPPAATPSSIATPRCEKPGWLDARRQDGLGIAVNLPTNDDTREGHADAASFRPRQGDIGETSAVGRDGNRCQPRVSRVHVLRNAY